MESPNSLYNNNNVNSNNKDSYGQEQNTDNIVIPSNFLISTKEIIARFPHNKRVGHYLLGRKLGEGSFAKVKEGLHTLTGQKVAIKVIDKKKAKEDAYVSKNMRREGKLLQMIIHPNIIQLYELMETENSYYLVTELCEGGDLMDYICARKYLSEACTRKFIRQIISAVDYLHRIGILHRDLKIENLLLDKNLNIKLIDFGLSNYTKSELCITQCGSPAYAAPELLAHKKYGCKVDVWSIGVNMYAMLTGNLPFTVEPFNIKSLYNKMMKNEMNPIPEHLSKSGEDLLKKLLNPDPIKRISLKEAMEHPWINEGYASSLKPFPYPNKPTEEQVNPTILRYMNSNMEFNLNEITENIKLNKPSSSLATYYLLLNKVKTMLMKIDPKKEKLKPRNTDTKPIVKDPKSTPTNTTKTNTTNNNTSNSQPTSQQILPIIPSTQSPVSKPSKIPGSVNVSNNATIANGYSLTKANPKLDLTNKYNTKIPERTHSPMNIHADTSQAQTNQVPSSAFSGAIKSLTQKYKTMHLTTSIDTANLSQSINANSNSISNNNNNSNNNHHTAPTTPTNINLANINNSVNPNFTFKTNYLNQSVEHAFNTNHNHKNGDTNLIQTQNSDSLSLSEDKHNSNSNNSNTNNHHIHHHTTKLSNSTNRSASNTPAFTKINNGTTNVEWTQMIKLTNGKAKSDLNNNDLLSNNGHVNHHNHQSNENSSLIHLSQNGTSSNSNNGSTGSSLHMPVLSYNNNNSTSSSNTNSVSASQPNRSAKSPIIKKISSPINLPSIEASIGRTTP